MVYVGIEQAVRREGRRRCSERTIKTFIKDIKGSKETFYLKGGKNEITRQNY